MSAPSESANWPAVRWRQWRDRQITDFLTPTFTTNGESLISRQAVAAKSALALAVLDAEATKYPRLLTNAETLTLLSNFRAFSKAQHWTTLTDQTGRKTHSLGLEISDAEYWTNAAAELEFPPLLQSQPFLQAMAAHAYKTAANMIQAENAARPDDEKWIILPFRAQFILPVDRSSYGRMLVLIPNEKLADGGVRDKWVLFVMATPEMPPTKEIRSVSIITIRRPPPPGAGTRAYFSDFLRERDARTGMISIRSTFTMTPNPSENCYECHKSAVLPIRPAVEYDFAADGRLVEKSAGARDLPKIVNQRIKDYGPPDFGVQEVAAYGPCLGPAEVERTDEFIRSASEVRSLADESIGKIRAAMNCASCHDQFAPINFPQAVLSNRDPDSLLGGRGMIQTYIEKGWMPPNNHLTADERTALWKCLMTEYLDLKTGRGLLADWLKNKPHQCAY